MEKACLTEIKAILKSLVLSSTEKMTISQLNRDYRETEGVSIPYRRLGYDSIEQFFEAIPDTLRVFGSGPSAIVCFVANEKSEHIHEMIMRQKKPKTKSRGRIRNRTRSKPRTLTNKFNSNSQPVKNISGNQLSPFQNVNRQHAVRTVKLWNGAPPTKSSTQNINALPQPSGIVCDNNKKVVLEKSNLKKYEDHVKQVSNLLEKNCFITQSAPPPLPLSKFTKNSCLETKKIPPVNDTKSEIVSEVKKSTQEIQTATATASLNKNNLLGTIKAPKAKEKSQPVKLSPDIQRLLAMRRNVKFLNPIKEDYSTDSTVEEVVNQQDKVINTKLNEKSKQLFDVDYEKEEQRDEAVPSFAAKYNVFRLDFPEHTVPFGNKIAAYKIPEDIVVGSCIKIFVSEIHSPFKFWFHVHKEEHELDLLMFHIERYYSTLCVEDLRIPLTSLMPGQVCAACYNGMWHRAEIVAPPVNDTIKVSFMDYGTVIEVKIEEIKFLASYFAQLPAQALRGCLSHIKPRQLHWTHEATLHFLNLTSDLMLYAKITEIDTENQILYMILCNTNGDEVVQINKSLVDQRYAFYSEAWKTEKIQKNNGKRVHHPREDFPTFSMIESGEYPNFTELYNLQRRGIDYEAIYDLILYNQCSILNKHENAPEIIRKLPYFLTTTNPFRSDIILELCATSSKADGKSKSDT